MNKTQRPNMQNQESGLTHLNFDSAGVHCQVATDECGFVKNSRW